jgi:hypothetical protein
MNNGPSGPVARVNAAGSNGRRNPRAQFIRWNLNAQSFSRALMDAQRDLVHLGLRIAGKEALAKPFSALQNEVVRCIF